MVTGCIKHVAGPHGKDSMAGPSHSSLAFWFVID